MSALSWRQQSLASVGHIFFVAGLAECGGAPMGAHALARCSRARTKSTLQLVPNWVSLTAGSLLECIGTV